MKNICQLIGVIFGVAATLVVHASPTEMRVRSVTYNVIPKKIDIEADVEAQAKARVRAGFSAETEALNEKSDRRVAEFRARGAVFSGEVKFASDGVWYESKTLVPQIMKGAKGVPYFEKFDGESTSIKTTALNNVFRGDRLGICPTLGDALFLYGALPKSVKKVSVDSNGATVTETFEGNHGEGGLQRLRLVLEGGVPVSAVSGWVVDDLKHPLATYKLQNGIVTVKRYGGQISVNSIETYGPERVVPYSPILKFEPGDMVTDLRGEKEHRYAWNGNLQAPPSSFSPENPQYPLYLTIAACGVLLVSVGTMRGVALRRKKLSNKLTIQ
jgi:hypothetical protein